MQRSSLGGMKADYLALVRRRQMYSGLMTIVFVAMLAAGFGLADSRNAGGFWDGLPKLFDFPTELLREAFEKIVGDARQSAGTTCPH